MSDVLFRYLLEARRRERSLLRRLLYTDEPLHEAGVEQLVETAAARILVTSQHEKHRQERVTVPASHSRPRRFYEQAGPNRPVEGHFQDRSEEFPLSGTLEVQSCLPCRSSGEVECPTCHGFRKTSCLFCTGRGQITCTQCQGEGEVASWEMECYEWRVERRSAEEPSLPPEQQRVRRALEEWLEIDDERVASAEPAVVSAHLGYQTAETLAVAARADDSRRRLEDEARDSGDRCLFLRTELQVAPVRYLVARLAEKARFHCLVGRGDRAREVTPRSFIDPWKCASWLALTVVYLNVARTGVFAPEYLNWLSESFDLGFAVLWAASWLLVFAGVRRVFRRRQPPVTTVGLIDPAGRSTAFLTCLAQVGSYLGRLRVLDCAYDEHLPRLEGRMPAHQPPGVLSIELPDGRKIRLIEVSNVHRLFADQIRQTARALDGVMILESPTPTEDLQAHIRQCAGKSFKIATLRIDGDVGDLNDPSPWTERTESDVLPLEAIRGAFVEDLRADVDWPTLFDRMWRPLDELLGLSKAGAEAR